MLFRSAKLTTQQLIEISEDEEFKKQLLSDLSEYERFYNKIIQLREENEKLKDVSPLAEMSTRVTIAMKTLTDKSPAKMSEMLMDGFEMGIKDAEENMVKAKDEGEKQEIIDLAGEYRRHLTENMEKYKKYIYKK